MRQIRVHTVCVECAYLNKPCTVYIFFFKGSRGKGLPAGARAVKIEHLQLCVKQQTQRQKKKQGFFGTEKVQKNPSKVLSIFYCYNVGLFLFCFILFLSLCVCVCVCVCVRLRASGLHIFPPRHQQTAEDISEMN